MIFFFASFHTLDTSKLLQAMVVKVLQWLSEELERSSYLLWQLFAIGIWLSEIGVTLLIINFTCWEHYFVSFEETEQNN